jgi:AraC-like DNA-binding protein
MSNAPKNAELKWQTSAASNPDAFEAYRESTRELFEVTDTRDVEAVFKSGGQIFLFDDIVIGRGYANGHQFERTARIIRRSGLDHISIILDFAGLDADRDGRSVNAGPGCIHFVDYSRPLKSEARQVDVINLAIPRARAEDWLLRPDMHGFVLPAEGAGVRLIAAHLRSIMAQGSGLSADEGVAAIDAALVMMHRCIGGTCPMDEAQTTMGYRTVRQMAVQYVDQNLLDPALTVDAIATDIGISRATLYRAFDSHGGVRSHIEGRRLDRAYGVLRRCRRRSPTIAEVAHSHGFVTTIQFSRAFRARFGLSPEDVPPWFSAAAPAREAMVFDSPRLDVAADWLRGGTRRDITARPRELRHARAG